MSEAEMLGIDLDILKGERFTHPNHYRMVREHYDRVVAADLRSRMSEYELAGERARAQARVEAEIVEAEVKRKRLEARRKAEATRKRRAGYEFSEEQLAIAEQSLRGSR